MNSDSCLAMMRTLSLLLLTLLLISCAKKGESVPPPDGLEDAVRNYYSQHHWPVEKIININVHSYPNDVYLLTVEGDSTYPLDETNGQVLKHGIKYLIAQKAYSNGQASWQIQLANKNNEKMYGIEP